MGNGIYCRKGKSQKNDPKSDSKTLNKLSTKDLILKIKSEIKNNLNSETSIAFLTGLDLNKILLSESFRFDIQTIIKLAEIKETEPILDISNKIYVMISSLAKKLNESNEKHKNLLRLVENMKTILDDLVVKINELDVNNLQYKNIPFKYLEVMIELFQIILTYQSGNLMDEDHVWWNKAKYGDNLQFYDSRFIELAGKIRYEIDFLESVKIKKSNNPRKTCSSHTGYGLRTVMKKNTTEIRDASDQVKKQKEEMKRIINCYLEDLTMKICKKFTEMMKILKEKTENITEEVDAFCEPHRVPENIIIMNKKKNKKW